MEIVEFQTVKAVLIGNSGAGKSALAVRLVSDTFESTDATHQATVRSLLIEPGAVLDRASIMLWDLAGQVDYNVVHQIFLDDARIAILVVDANTEDLDTTVAHWSSFLASHEWTMKLLVAAKCDLRQVPEDLNSLADKYSFTGHYWTSAKTGQGVNELREGLRNGIQWEQLPLTTTSPTFAVIRRTFSSLKADGTLFVTPQQIVCEAAEVDGIYPDAILTIAHRLEMDGHAYVLNPRPDTSVILLQPELLTAYGSALLLAARSNRERPGTFEEARALRGDFDIAQRDRVSLADERILLDAVVSLFIDHGLCRRDRGLLIFQDATVEFVDCFISYNSADGSIATLIGERLLDQGIYPWLDKWELLAGESITDSIADGIEHASSFLILMSPNSMRANWVREELKIALQKRHAKKDFRIIPILLSECEIPPFLRDYRYVDWRNGEQQALREIVNALHGLRRRS